MHDARGLFCKTAVSGKLDKSQIWEKNGYGPKLAGPTEIEEGGAGGVASPMGHGPNGGGGR